MAINFDEYSEKHVHFFDESLPDTLVSVLQSMNKSFSLIDLGCGDGRTLYALNLKGLLRNANRVVGVDISKTRIKRLKKNLPFVDGVIADIQNLSISDNSFDIAISNQVIEHIPDDRKCLSEIYRVLRPSGTLYITTVLKKWYGFWIYVSKKGFKLDPTHVREYSSVDEFLHLLKENNFTILMCNTYSVKYPLSDMIVRALIKLKFKSISESEYIYMLTLKNKLDKKIKLKIPVVGYKTIEVVCKVRK